MRRQSIALTGLVVPLAALVVGSGAPDDEILFAQTHLIIELNDTAGDVGVQVFLDGDPWRQLRVFNPSGRRILEIRGTGSLELQGLTELFFESSEPPLSELSLEEFKRRFPEGEYEFEGITIEGDFIEGTASFTHVIPDAPVVLSPPEGSMQNAANTVISWLDVANPPGSEITAYQVIVTDLVEVFPKRTFSVHVPAGTTSMTVPAEFLQLGADYEFEVLAIEAGGNQTITASFFSTMP